MIAVSLSWAVVALCPKRSVVKSTQRETVLLTPKHRRSSPVLRCATHSLSHLHSSSLSGGPKSKVACSSKPWHMTASACASVDGRCCSFAPIEARSFSGLLQDDLTSKLYCASKESISSCARLSRSCRSRVTSGVKPLTAAASLSPCGSPPQ